MILEMELETSFDEKLGLLTLKLGGDITRKHVDEVIDIVHEHTNRNLKCILDVTSMGVIDTSVVKYAVDTATGELQNGFSNYCLVAGGMIFLMLSMFSDKELVKNHLAGDDSLARKKLGI